MYQLLFLCPDLFLFLDHFLCLLLNDELIITIIISLCLLLLSLSAFASSSLFSFSILFFSCSNRLSSFCRSASTFFWCFSLISFLHCSLVKTLADDFDKTCGADIAGGILCSRSTFVKSFPLRFRYFWCLDWWRQ